MEQEKRENLSCLPFWNNQENSEFGINREKSGFEYVKKEERKVKRERE